MPRDEHATPDDYLRRVAAFEMRSLDDRRRARTAAIRLTDTDRAEAVEHARGIMSKARDARESRRG